jgi:hypothetical protein
MMRCNAALAGAESQSGHWFTVFQLVKSPLTVNLRDDPRWDHWYQELRSLHPFARMQTDGQMLAPKSD